ncbi:hypothetical protein AAG570_005663 [Ranatra chinensis]|uniref:Uncharacterized protein n=1 Tax=Ranatra chinensis TaxID=642074 RepID=A0ABD0XYG2_9HEMI
MASKRRNMFYENKNQETMEIEHVWALGRHHQFGRLRRPLVKVPDPLRPALPIVFFPCILTAPVECLWPLFKGKAIGFVSDAPYIPRIRQFFRVECSDGLSHSAEDASKRRNMFYEKKKQEATKIGLEKEESSRLKAKLQNPHPLTAAETWGRLVGSP